MGLTERSFLERMELMGLTESRVVTNADRINAMTNEEKASFLALIELRFLPKRDITAELDKSYNKWLNWLKQEVEDK